MDVVGASEEQTLANWEVGEAFLFFFGEFENVTENIDSTDILL